MLDSDKYFFHYTTREAAFGGILAERKLRLSTYGAMRDPLENQSWRFTFGGDGPRPEDDAALAAHLQEYQRFEDMANQGVRDRSYLLSLTIDSEEGSDRQRKPFRCGWARARMWEQYAENHRGVCLAFDRKRLTASVRESAPGLVTYDRPVVYDRRGLLKPLVNHQALKDEPGFLSRYIDENSGPLFFTKARDWETEHEYRFVVIGQEDSPVVVDYQNSLAAVIAGGELPEWEEPAIVAICEAASADAVRVKWANWRPGLVNLAGTA